MSSLTRKHTSHITPSTNGIEQNTQTKSKLRNTNAHYARNHQRSSWDNARYVALGIPMDLQ